MDAFIKSIVQKPMSLRETSKSVFMSRWMGFGFLNPRCSAKQHNKTNQ